LKRGIDLAAAAVVKDIERRAKKVQSSEEISQVGTISANGDKLVGKMIADAMKKVGNEGVITVEEAKTPKVETFAGFSTMLGFYLVPVGALMTQPWQAGISVAMAGNFVPLLGPTNVTSQGQK
jgi:chaperonin GroEL (HSP60 family)